MPDDPYAPEPPLAGGPAAPSAAGGILVGECFRIAWDRTWKSFPTWLGVGIVYTVLALLSYATCIGIFLVVPVLVWGGVLYVLHVHDDEGRDEFGDLFAGFSRYGSVIGPMIVVFLLGFLVGIPGQIVQFVGAAADSEALVFIGLLVNLAWVFLVTIRFSFASFLVVDRGLDGLEAFQASWRLTSGSTGSLVLLVLATALVSIVGFLACIVGILPASMISCMMWTAAYRQLAGRAPATD